MEEKTYTSIKRLKRDRVLETSHGTIMADTEVKLLNKLHQICSGTVIVDVPVDVKVVQAAFDHTKAKFIRSHFQGQKIAIFYKFTAEKHVLEMYFGGRIAADTNEFNAGGPEKVYISQVQSGREGLNLSSADCLVMYNIDFSAVSYWQARARIQVKDRVKPAIVYWIFAKGGIEDYIYECVKKKQDFTINHFRKTYFK
jgi:SNF2 family DNA or RNA helicase